jgi:hypothetical protein
MPTLVAIAVDLENADNIAEALEKHIVSFTKKMLKSHHADLGYAHFPSVVIFSTSETITRDTPLFNVRSVAKKINTRVAELFSSTAATENKPVLEMISQSIASITHSTITYEGTLRNYDRAGLIIISAADNQRSTTINRRIVHEQMSALGVPIVLAVKPSLVEGARNLGIPDDYVIGFENTEEGVQNLFNSLTAGILRDDSKEFFVRVPEEQALPQPTLTP